MVSVANIVGYIIAIAVAKAIGYLLAKYHYNKKKSLLVDAINDVAEMINNNGSKICKIIRDVLKEVAWYIKNDKYEDKTAMLEDVKQHIPREEMGK